MLLLTGGWSSVAQKSNDGVLQVTLASETVDLDLLFFSLSQKVAPSCQFHHVANHCVASSEHEVPLLKEWQVSDHPSLGLGLFEAIPFIRAEESIRIVEVEVLAEKSQDLSLRSEGVVANG